MVFDQNCDQGQKLKKVIDDKVCTTKRVKISRYTIHNDVSKIKGKHFVFEASIVEIYMHLLIDKGSETKLINEFLCIYIESAPLNSKKR